MSTDRLLAIRDRLRAAYRGPGLWGETNPAWPLTADLKRGHDPHLAYLTLVYTISGGRAPVQLWTAARKTLAANPTLFDPAFLAYADPKTLVAPLRAHGLTQKPKSEATVWQRIGQALVMRAGGSVQRLLTAHEHDARQLLTMLKRSKTTFPVLSGPQTAPRWLYGLVSNGQQSLAHAGALPVPVSAAAGRALEALSVSANRVSAAIFDPLDALGRRGCRQRRPQQPLCPVAAHCPVAQYCRYAPDGEERLA